MATRWSYRGYLPHVDQHSQPTFFTFRLAGSLPRTVCVELKKKVRELPAHERALQYSRLVERYLDEPHEPTWLRDDRLCQIIENELLRHHGKRYELHGWVILPNHIHVCATLRSDFMLRNVVKSWKGASSRRCNLLLGREKEPFWASGYFDRAIRDDNHYKRVMWYIWNNPVKCGLCEDPREYRWSSLSR